MRIWLIVTLINRGAYGAEAWLRIFHVRLRMDEPEDMIDACALSSWF